MPSTSEDASSDAPGLPILRGARVWVGGHNIAAKADLEKTLAGVERPATGPIDVVIIVPLSVEEGLYFAGKLRNRMNPVSAVWVIYPIFSAPGQCEFDGTIEELERGMDELGFVGTGVASLSSSYDARGFQLGDAGMREPCCPGAPE